MAWTIRELRVDDAELRRVYDISKAALTFERPRAPMWSERECFQEFRKDDPADKVVGVAALDGDDTMVGAGILVVPLTDNLEKAFIEVWVEPELRRRGIGTAIADRIAELARALGRTTMLGQASYPFDERDTHPYRRFAEGLGYELALTQARRELALPVPDAEVQAWVDEARPHYEGRYRIESIAGLVPDPLLPSFCYLNNQIEVDAPQGDETWEAAKITPEIYKQRYQLDVDAGRQLHHALALDNQSGDVVAFTTHSITDDEPDVYQWGTLVHVDHRGNRLGLAVKAQALRDLQRNYPDSTRVSTMNAESNGQMVAINERMGFKPIEVVGEFQRKLA